MIVLYKTLPPRYNTPTQKAYFAYKDAACESVHGALTGKRVTMRGIMKSLRAAHRAEDRKMLPVHKNNQMLVNYKMRVVKFKREADLEMIKDLMES